jgi:hypothetical protein
MISTLKKIQRPKHERIRLSREILGSGVFDLMSAMMRRSHS